MGDYERWIEEAAAWLGAGVTSQEAWRGKKTLEAWFGWRPSSLAARAAIDELAALNHSIAHVEAERRRGTEEEEDFADCPANDND